MARNTLSLTEPEKMEKNKLTSSVLIATSVQDAASKKEVKHSITEITSIAIRFAGDFNLYL